MIGGGEFVLPAAVLHGEKEGKTVLITAAVHPGEYVGVETAVELYGNSIARKPWHDTIGIGLGALSNLGLCAVLVPAFGLTGAALALAASNGIAFLYRSVTGQMYYRTVASYAKTISGFLLAFAVTAIGTLLWQHFIIKFDDQCAYHFLLSVRRGADPPAL